MHGVRSYGFRPADRKKSVESNGPSNRPFQNNVFFMALSEIGQRSIPERPYPAHIVVYQAIIGFIKRSIPDRPFSEAVSQRGFFMWKANKNGRQHRKARAFSGLCVMQRLVKKKIKLGVFP